MYPKAAFIAPSQVLRDELRKRGADAYTPHVFFKDMSVHRSLTHVIIDECSQFPVDYAALVQYMLPKVTIIILGDVFQTPFVNYQNNRALTTFADVGLTNNIVDVYKIPQDITAMLNEKHGFTIRTHSPVEKGLFLCSDNIDKIQKKIGQTPVITYHNTTAQELRLKGFNAHTVTTYTGSRAPQVIYYIDSKAVNSRAVARSEYIYTAMSRATTQLIVMGETQEVRQYYHIQGTMLQTYEEINNIYTVADVRIPKDDEFPVTVPKAIAVVKTPADVAVDILQTCVTAANDPDNQAISIGTAAIAPVHEDASLKTNLNVIAPRDQTVKAFVLPNVRKLVKNQVSNNQLETVRTLVKRYACGFKKKHLEKMSRFTENELMNGFCKAIYGDTHSHRRLQLALARIATPEFLSERVQQYYKSLQEKINKNGAVAQDITKEFVSLEEALQFFNKRQSKWCPDSGFDKSDKVGQGVASTSKRYNIVMAAYARGLLDAVRQLIKEQGRPIILATHDSEAEINDLYTQFITGEHHKNWACNDFSEWDASFRKAFTNLTIRLIKMIGCPPFLARMWGQFRSSWAMLYRSKDGLTVVKGKEKQFSGNPFTICENTIGNMALCFALFEYAAIRLALFKGDDSAVNCRSCHLTERGKVILGYTGHGLKMHNLPYGEFAGWFLTEEGIFPDVYRYAAKFIGKAYRDQDHFNEALMSLQERCSAVKTQTQLAVGCCVVSDYYAKIFPEDARIDPSDAESLFGFLLNSRSIKFSMLQEQNMSIVQLDKPLSTA
jgi:hypothetical protein